MQRNAQAAFTLFELLVLIAVLILLAAAISPVLARSRPGSRSYQCFNNLRQLTSAFHAYAQDNRGNLVAPDDTTLRPSWVIITEDALYDIQKAVFYPYTGSNILAYGCPASPYRPVTLIRPYGHSVIRAPRDYSMSHVFGRGDWLDKSYNPSQRVWRTYARSDEIVAPSSTFLFIDEHPDSINDGALANACTGAQPYNYQSEAQIIDYPANYHSGGCDLSFADGHVEAHRWQGTKLRNVNLYCGCLLSLNVPAGDSDVDMKWLAARTTVRR
ncbi:MAG TPA: hypothetical protein VFL42_07500 [Terriglobales bacterium]|nr:hypothetical protein [Terriglobales bacterium]